MAKGARLLSECGGKLPPRVRIPLSPPALFSYQIAVKGWHRLSSLCRRRLNHHGRFGPTTITKFLVGAVSAPPLWVDFQGKNEKKPRIQTPPLCEETLLKFPGFPEPRNLFHSSRRERRRTFVRNVPWHLSLHRQRSRHLSPLPAISAQPAHLEPSG